MCLKHDGRGICPKPRREAKQIARVSFYNGSGLVFDNIETSGAQNRHYLIRDRALHMRDAIDRCEA
jgi:hypothetical protein